MKQASFSKLGPFLIFFVFLFNASLFGRSARATEIFSAKDNSSAYSLLAVSKSKRGKRGRGKSKFASAENKVSFAKLVEARAILPLNSFLNVYGLMGEFLLKHSNKAALGIGGAFSRILWGLAWALR